MRAFILILLCYPLYVTALNVGSTPTSIAHPMQTAEQAWAGITNKADALFLDQFITRYPYAEERQIAFSLRFYGVQMSRALPNYYDFIDHYGGTLVAEQAQYELFQLIKQPAGYLEFIHHYPNSPAAAVAKLQLAASTFDIIRQFKGISEYDKLIAMFPMTEEALLAEKLAEQRALELETNRLETILAPIKKSLQQAEQLFNSTECGESDSACWLTMSKKVRAIGGYKQKIHDTITKEAKKIADKMIAAVKQAKQALNPVLKQHHQRLVRRYCYMLYEHPDYRTTDAAAECRVEARHQEVLVQWKQIRQTIINRHTDLIQALQTEWENTRQVLQTGFERLHLDKLAYQKALAGLTQGMAILHQDLAQVNDNLVGVRQGLIEVQTILDKKNQLLSTLHRDLNQIHRQWVALNQNVSQHQKAKADWQQIMAEIIQRDFVKSSELVSERTTALTQIPKQIAKAIHFQSHLIVYNTDRLVIAEQQMRQAMKDFLVQFIDAIKPGQGCGSEGTEDLVPDTAGDADFYPACQAHDKCYDTCSTTQKYCDVQFKNDLDQECHRLDIGVTPCLGLADIYYWAVAKFGGDGWKEGQTSCI